MDLENSFLYAHNFGTEIFLKIEREQILDTCLGVIQTLDQGPGGALKIVFF